MLCGVPRGRGGDGGGGVVVFCKWRQGGRYLALDEDGAETVEELEGGNDVALDQDRGYYCSARPVARADGHLIEPLFQRELADGSSASAAAAEHVVHVHGCVWGERGG